MGYNVSKLIVKEANEEIIFLLDLYYWLQEIIEEKE